MKLGITIYSVAQLVEKEGMTVQQFIEFAAGVGFEGVDLGYFWQDKKREFAELAGWLEKNKIVLSGYIVGNNFAAVANTEKQTEEIQKVKSAIDEAALLGSRTLRIFAGHREGLSWEEGAPLVRDCFASCTEHAEKKNVVLALENHAGLAANSEHMLYYLKEINSPFFRFNVDTGNFLFGNEPPEEGVKKTSRYAAMVHVKDCRNVSGQVTSCPLGQGEVNIKNCLAILKNAGYQGFLSLEYEVESDPRQGILASFSYLKECLRNL